LIFQPDLFIITYSVANFTSYENVYARWLPEVRRHCPQAKIMLVGKYSATISVYI